jgi:hypothetical protein
MENKWLSIQSFQRNQSLLDYINKVVIYLKLVGKNIDSKISIEEVTHAKGVIEKFLTKLNGLVVSVENDVNEPLTGVDLKLRSFAKSFVDARSRRTKFKSPLFVSDIEYIKNLLSSNGVENKQALIDSLNDLKLLLDEQISLDTKEIISEI